MPALDPFLDRQNPIHIKKLMDKKINVYLDAEEAVDLGIADIII